MNEHPELPSFKPVVRLLMLGENDLHPKKLPFIDGDRVYCYANTSEKDFIEDPLKHKAWVTGEIKSPEFWWLSYIQTGFHSNFSKVKELCGDAIPEGVVDLYHPVWQLRFVLGHPAVDLVENAKFQWSYFWYQKTGRYKSTQVNYVN